MTGPLTGYSVVEAGGVGPVPYAAMLLADLGARVIRFTRLAPSSDDGERADATHPMYRGRSTLPIDLRHPGAAAVALRLSRCADVLLEGFRPGVMERLGLGPEVCDAVNPRLVYGRLTGWGQTGPLAALPGHDINYLATTGALWAIGPSDRPPSPPINLLGDFAGGSLFLVAGILAALLERERSGLGQVVDSAIVDGVASLSTFVHGLRGSALWSGGRGENTLDGGHYAYNVYRCGDGGFVAVGALEGRFRELMLETVATAVHGELARPSGHAEDQLRDYLKAAFGSRPRAFWAEAFSGLPACVTPVLDWDEAAEHPHHRARATFCDQGGRLVPAPAPRLSRTPASLAHHDLARRSDARHLLTEVGYHDDEIDALVAARVVGV